MKSYEAAEEKKTNDKRDIFGGLRRAKADKKLRSILFLPFGKEGKRVFSEKNIGVKIHPFLLRNFETSWTQLSKNLKMLQLRGTIF